MYKKKLICLAFASLLPLGAAMAEEQPSTEQNAGTETAEPTAVEEEAVEVEAKEASDADEAAERPVYGRMSMEERWKEREKRYEELKARAEEAGVMLPEHPPWHDRAAMTEPSPQMQKRMEHRQKMMSMTPEEREAYRKERYQEMRSKAQEIGLEMPETPPWEQRKQQMESEWLKHQEIIKGMTDEERAACHAMHRRHMRQSGPGPMKPGRGMYPPMREGRGPGYGYGPGPYGPAGNFWGPQQ